MQIKKGGVRPHSFLYTVHLLLFMLLLPFPRLFFTCQVGSIEAKILTLFSWTPSSPSGFIAKPITTIYQAYHRCCDLHGSERENGVTGKICTQRKKTLLLQTAAANFSVPFFPPSHLLYLLFFFSPSYVYTSKYVPGYMQQ